ncbi:hypothetical protein [Sulfuritalea sp.]|jgi:hypothetical protein|uniref:hypothetical protein n=1 Tax=Sulfuritalea sp. TaxID=2480090 RepID=UPI001AC2C1F9|nr:hypothetical protein [Sulfuritalea sp.]MBN8474943.1 sulfotransferase family 2 domain-containing protein [Sulfuritalea sp.]
MKVVFPHVPKCAGSSIQKQLEARGDVYLDYFNHPTWNNEADTAAGQIEQEKIRRRLVAVPAWIVFGHFAACAYDDLLYDRKVILLRDPLERAVSQFHFVQQLLPDNEVTRRRHKEVAAIKDGRMAIEEFAQLPHIRFFYSDYYLKNLAVDERLMILSVENLEVSFEAISTHCGLRLDRSIWVNESRHNRDFGHLSCYFSRDTDLYKELLRVAGERWLRQPDPTHAS